MNPDRNNQFRSTLLRGNHAGNVGAEAGTIEDMSASNVTWMAVEQALVERTQSMTEGDLLLFWTNNRAICFACPLAGPSVEVITREEFDQRVDAWDQRFPNAEPIQMKPSIYTKEGDQPSPNM